MRKNPPDGQSSSRRDFIKASTVAAIGTSIASRLDVIPGAYAAGSDAIKIGLIGCGGRGTGAVADAMRKSQGVSLVAMGDAFKDRIQDSKKNLARVLGAEFSAPSDDHCFSGFDAFEKVLGSDVNYIILATPPGFRPQHLKAAVAAGKHIFTEKPVAVDGSGIRTVLGVYEEAKAKGLGIAAGTQRRHQTGYLETMKRIHDGAIGDIVA